MGNNVIAIQFMRSFLLTLTCVVAFLSSLSVVGLTCIWLVCDKRLLSKNTWQVIMKMLLVMYHRNQPSTYLKYDVLGRLFWIEVKRAARTRRDVTDPINRLLKFDSSMKNVRYPKNHISHVGKKVDNIWLVKLRLKVTVYMNQTCFPLMPVSTSILWM